MCPSRGEDGAGALRNYRDFGHVDAVGSGVPGADGEFGEVQFLGDVGEAAGMFMAAVSQNDGFFSDPGQYR